MSGRFYSILLVTGWQGPEHRLAVKSQYFVLIWHLCSLYCLRGWAGDHWPVLPPAPHCPSQWPQMRWSPLTHQHDGHPAPAPFYNDLIYFMGPCYLWLWKDFIVKIDSTKPSVHVDSAKRMNDSKGVFWLYLGICISEPSHVTAGALSALSRSSHLAPSSQLLHSGPPLLMLELITNQGLQLLQPAFLLPWRHFHTSHHEFSVFTIRSLSKPPPSYSVQVSTITRLWARGRVCVWPDN